LVTEAISDGTHGLPFVADSLILLKTSREKMLQQPFVEVAFGRLTPTARLLLKIVTGVEPTDMIRQKGTAPWGKIEPMRGAANSPDGEDSVDLEQLRARLRGMTDRELEQACKAGDYKCTPQANLGKPPREIHVIERREAWAEWDRRECAPS